MHWLAPKLRHFAIACPEVTVNLSSQLQPFDFSRQEFDAAIHYGARDWQGVNYLHLAEEYVLPVCAPNLIKAPVAAPAQLLDLPLLHLETRPSAWEEWFSHHGIKSGSLPGMLIDQFSTMAQAAAHELGVAILPLYLAAGEIDAGRLVFVFGAPVRASGDYYLVWPDNRPVQPPLEKFITWIRSVSEAFWKFGIEVPLVVNL